MENYFEGYYFKITNNQDTLCFIVGYTVGENSHSFIQVFGSMLPKMYYFEYETLMCTMMRKPLYIRIKNNIFTKNKVQVELENDEIILQGKVSFTNVVPLIKTRYTPTIMGPLSYIPCKCVHELVNVYSKANGRFRVRNSSIVFDNAFGYIEGDRGTSFPTSYIWLQAMEENFSIFLSLALVDTKYGSFKGMIACLHTSTTQYRLASYYLSIFTILTEENGLNIVCNQGDLTLILHISHYEEEFELAAPECGIMMEKTSECLEAFVSLALFKNGECIVSKEKIVASVELKNVDDLL